MGVVALWLLVAVEVTALAMKKVSRKWWRNVHIASYFVFWAVSIHAALAGTDTSKPLYTVTAIVALAAVVFAASYRIALARAAQPQARTRGAVTLRSADDGGRRGGRHTLRDRDGAPPGALAAGPGPAAGPWHRGETRRPAATGLRVGPGCGELPHG